MSEQELLQCLQVLGDPVRLSILNMLREKPAHGFKLLEGLSISQPTLSHHMKALRDADLVTVKSVDRKKIYAINAVKLGNIARELQEIAEGTL